MKDYKGKEHIVDEDKTKKPLYTKEELKGYLHKYIMQITFLKVDGTERIMNCTLLPMALPRKTVSLVSEDINLSTRPENDNLLAVWDIENKAWRSFRVDSVNKPIRIERDATDNYHDGSHTFWHPDNLGKQAS